MRCLRRHRGRRSPRPTRPSPPPPATATATASPTSPATSPRTRRRTSSRSTRRAPAHRGSRSPSRRRSSSSPGRRSSTTRARATAASFDVTAATSDAESGIASVAFPIVFGGDASTDTDEPVLGDLHVGRHRDRGRRADGHGDERRRLDRRPARSRSRPTRPARRAARSHTRTATRSRTRSRSRSSNGSDGGAGLDLDRHAAPARLGDPVERHVRHVRRLRDDRERPAALDERPDRHERPLLRVPLRRLRRGRQPDRLHLEQRGQGRLRGADRDAGRPGPVPQRHGDADGERRPTPAAPGSPASPSSARPTGGGSWTTISTDTASPWQASLDTTALADGGYDFRVVATDGAGNATTSPSSPTAGSTTRSRR